MAEIKPPITFLSLPPELRSRIYELSRCLLIVHCKKCLCYAYGDETERSCYDYVKKDATCVFVDSSRSDVKAMNFGYLIDTCNARNSTGSMNQQPQLTHANRQIRLETLPIYYGINRFLIQPCPFGPNCRPFGVHLRYAKPRSMLSGDVEPLDPVNPALTWLRAIGPHNVRLIRDLVFFTKEDQRNTDILETWSGLKHLGVLVDNGVVDEFGCYSSLERPTSRGAPCLSSLFDPGNETYSQVPMSQQIREAREARENGRRRMAARRRIATAAQSS